MNPLREEYERMGISEDLGIEETGQDSEVLTKIQEIFGEDAAFIESSGFLSLIHI